MSLITPGNLAAVTTHDAPFPESLTAPPPEKFSLRSTADTALETYHSSSTEDRLSGLLQVDRDQQGAACGLAKWAIA